VILPWVEEVRKLAEKCRHRDDTDDAFSAEIRPYLASNPSLRTLVPYLLERGDPAGRELACIIARAAKTPEMLSALREFVLGRFGSLEQRMRMAEVVSQAGMLPKGPLRMWAGGKWTEVLYMGYEIHSEPSPSTLAGRAYELYDRAVVALRRGDPASAEQFLRKALQLAPDSPQLVHNLATAVGQQGRAAEAEAMVEDLHRRLPDYLFARTAVAQFRIRDGNLAAAKALIEPLFSKNRFHVSEFGAFSVAQIKLLIAQGEIKGAKGWLDMLAESDPDNPALPGLRAQLGVRSFMKRIPGIRKISDALERVVKRESLG
jgi:predicted Zn-dependent protease